MSFMLPKSMDRPTGSQGKIPPRRAKQGHPPPGGVRINEARGYEVLA